MAGLRIDIIDNQLAGFLKIAEQQVVDAQRALVERTYEVDIVGRSPILTGFYASNHRIILRGAGGTFKAGGQVELFPNVKPSDAQPGDFVPNIPDATAKELGKLDRLALGDIVIITTRVEYADSVEQKHGVYSGAEAMLGRSL